MGGGGARKVDKNKLNAPKRKKSDGSTKPEFWTPPPARRRLTVTSLGAYVVLKIVNSRLRFVSYDQWVIRVSLSIRRKKVYGGICARVATVTPLKKKRVLVSVFFKRFRCFCLTRTKIGVFWTRVRTPQYIPTCGGRACTAFPYFIHAVPIIVPRALLMVRC